MVDPYLQRRAADLRDTIRLASADLEELASRIKEARTSLSAGADDLKIYGAAALAHGYYTQLEKAFERVARDLNHSPVEGPDWHRRLMRSMTLDQPGVRPPLLETSVARELDEILRFRHLFRNLYVLDLEIGKVIEVLDKIEHIHPKLLEDLRRFTDFLAQLASGD